MVLTDSELNAENLEDAALAFGSSHLNSLKKYLHSRDDRRRETRRFDAAVKQAAKARIEEKNRSNKGKKRA